jgi:hypothetical protein
LDSSILLITNESLEKDELRALDGLRCLAVTWAEAPSIRPSDFEILVIDTRIGSSGTGYETEFDKMQPDIEKLLQAGGVVFVLAGPTVEVRKWKGSNNMTYHETNYDFLPQFLLDASRLASSESKAGTNFETDKKWRDYFSHVTYYYKIMYGLVAGEQGTEIKYYSRGWQSETVRPFAVTRATEEVVACLITWKGGNVVILPPPDDMYQPLVLLITRGKELYQQNVEQVREHLKSPEWIEQYKIKEQKELEAKESELLANLQAIRVRANELFVATSALFTTGRELERAVMKMFSDFGWKVDDLTKKAGPIDYIVHDSRGFSNGLLVALTGTDGYIDANHRKVAQLFGALAEAGEGQRLVFLVNALAKEDPNSRTTEKCITEPALKRMAKHGICVLFVPDLYKLWIDRVEGRRSSDEVFRLVKETGGAFHYTIA